MAQITLTITESEKEIVSGIPQYISIEADEICNIYYTFDKSTPTTNSSIYVDKLYLTSEYPTLTVKLYATNGSDESEIYELKYGPTLTANKRLPMSQTSATSTKKRRDPYPFGTISSQPDVIFIDRGNSNRNMFDGTVDGYSNGYDSDGYANNYTNLPYNIENYKIVYSTVNSKGESYPGVGNLPAEVIVELKKDRPEETNANDKMFDPRAFVTYVDANDPNIGMDFIQSQSMSFEDPTVNDGSKLTGLRNTTAQLVRTSYSNDGTMTTYHFDSCANRWLIVKSKYARNKFVDNLSGYVLGRTNGAQYVKTWVPYIRRYISG